MDFKNERLMMTEEEARTRAKEYIKAVGVLPKQIDSFVLLNILNGSDENENN